MDSLAKSILHMTDTLDLFTTGDTIRSTMNENMIEMASKLEALLPSIPEFVYVIFQKLLYVKNSILLEMYSVI